MGEGNLEAKSRALQFTGKMIKEKVNTLSQLVSEYLPGSRGAGHQRFGLPRFAFTVCLLRRCPLEGAAGRGGRLGLKGKRKRRNEEIRKGEERTVKEVEERG